MLAKNRIKEGKLSEAISGSDRKVMMMIVREILENLKKVSKSIKPSNTIGRGVLSILRAMTYTPDNANYKNYKKYFPKTFNSKLTQKRVAQFHKQTDKVQLTMVKQAMGKVLGEGKLNERLKRFKVYVSGESEPLILVGKNEKDVKHIAHQMIQNSGVRIRKVVKEGNLTEKKETGIDVARRIVKNKQHEKGVDMQTANLIMKIYHAYDKNPALQKKLEKLPLKKLAQGVWRFVK
jgi:hypothetical protein